MMYEDMDIRRIKPIFKNAECVTVGKGKHARRYIDFAGITFDIETSSFYDNGEKRAIPYAFMITFYNFDNEKVTYLFRTMEDTIQFMNKVKSFLRDKFGGAMLICYVHNLSYEMGFCFTYFKIIDAFTNGDKRAFMYARTEDTEFRCSLMLTCLPLSALSKETAESKLTMDYSLLRTSKTPLTNDEKAYMQADTEVLASFLVKRCKDDGYGLTGLPYTKTGYPRRRYMNYCLADENYQNLMRELTINNVDELELLERAFRGGYTADNPYYTNKVLENLSSYDLTSAYPAVFCRPIFCMSRMKTINVSTQKEVLEICKKCFAVFTVKLTDIECKYPKGIISESAVVAFESDTDEELDPVVANGRIMMYEGSIYLPVDNIEFEYILKFYNIGKWEVQQMTIGKKDYLPKRFVEVMLELYRQKTQYKGQKGVNPETNRDFEVDLQGAKADLNGSYGMMCQHVIMDEFELVYNEDFDCATMEDVIYEDSCAEYEHSMKALNDYNNSRKRFTFYPWALTITSAVRATIYEAMLECIKIDENPKSETFGEIIVNDWVYSDTDSVKIRNVDDHTAYFDNYNKSLYPIYEGICKRYGFKMDMFDCPDIKGKKHLLGAWDLESYKGLLQFKSLGSKRYAYTELNEKSGEIEFHITVAGLKKHGKLLVEQSKKLGYNVYEYGANNYIWDNGGFDFFTDDMVIPAEYSGRIIHTYIDNKTEGDVVDYKGIPYHYKQNTAIHLETSEYNLSMHEYRKYIDTVKEWK